MANDNGNYKLTMAEFKGQVIQSLKDIQREITELKAEQKSQYKELNDRLNNQRMLSACVGAVGGIITAAITALGIKRI